MAHVVTHINGITDPKKLKQPGTTTTTGNLPIMQPNVVGPALDTTAFLPTVDRTPAPTTPPPAPAAPTAAPIAAPPTPPPLLTTEQLVQRGVTAAGTRLTEAEARTPELAVELEKDRIARQEATERQRLQDILGKAGLAGTGRGIAAQAQLTGQLAATRADILRETELAQRQARGEELGAAISGTVAFGELAQRRELVEITEGGKLQRLREGFVFEGTEAELDRDLTELVEGNKITEIQANRFSTDQNLLKGFGHDLTVLGIQQGFTGTQNELDRELDKLFEAGRIKSADKDRASLDFRARKAIESNETIAELQSTTQKDIARDVNDLAQQGIDVNKAKLFGYTRDLDGDGEPDIDNPEAFVPGLMQNARTALGFTGDTIELNQIELLGLYDDDGNLVTPGTLELTSNDDIRAATTLFGGLVDTTGDGVADTFIPGTLQLNRDSVDINKQGLNNSTASLFGYFRDLDGDGEPDIDNPDAFVPGTLIIAGLQMGLKQKTHDAQVLEVFGGTFDDAGNFIDNPDVTGRLQILANDFALNVSSINFNKLFQLASILPPEERGEAVVNMLDMINAGLPADQQIVLPTPVTADEAKGFRDQAAEQLGPDASEGDIAELAAEIAFEEGKLYRGLDGISNPPLGSVSYNPNVIDSIKSPDALIGQNTSYKKADGSFQSFVVGNHYQFTQDMNAEPGLGYRSLPAGQYQLKSVNISVPPNPPSIVLYYESTNGDLYAAGPIGGDTPASIFRSSLTGPNSLPEARSIMSKLIGLRN